MKASLATLSAAAVLALSSAPVAAQAVDNVTYTVTRSFQSVTESDETWLVTLSILNNSINGPTGINSLALSRPEGFLSASLDGWTSETGSSSCSNNFFCFSGYAAAAPVLSFNFTVTADNSAFGFSSYAPEYTVGWVGAPANDPAPSPVNPVPEPGTYAMMLAGLGVMGAVLRRRRRQI